MSAPIRHTLPKAERISGRTTILHLVRSGRYVNAGCVRCCYLPRGDEAPSRLMVSVPKRLFKRAVKRNLLKRRLRESWRLQKELLPTGMDVMLIYTAPKVFPFADLFQATGRILTMIAADGKA